jgi:hypothetical protein
MIGLTVPAGKAFIIDDVAVRTVNRVSGRQRNKLLRNSSDKRPAESSVRTNRLYDQVHLPRKRARFLTQSM